MAHEFCYSYFNSGDYFSILQCVSRYFISPGVQLVLQMDGVRILVGCVPRTIFVLAERNEKIRKKEYAERNTCTPTSLRFRFFALLSFLSATTTYQRSCTTRHYPGTADERG